MSTATKAAEVALAQAVTAAQDARIELEQAREARASLHTRLSNGDATVTVEAIATADATVRRAELLAQAAEDAIEPAKAAVADADLAAVVAAAQAWAATAPGDEVRDANRAAAAAQRHAEELTAHYHRRLRDIAHDLRARGAARVQPDADETGWVGPTSSPEGFNIAGQGALTTWDSLR